jgi:hypothetical protein
VIVDEYGGTPKIERNGYTVDIHFGGNVDGIYDPAV